MAEGTLTPSMIIIKRFLLVSIFLVSFRPLLAVESGMFRLLSVSDSEKLILVSQIPSKTKYLLDASSAKIVVNGKPAEIQDLDSYAIIQVKMELHKSSKNGVEIDGTAREIRITTPDKAK